jgi:hypothetical protein
VTAANSRDQQSVTRKYWTLTLALIEKVTGVDMRYRPWVSQRGVVHWGRMAGVDIAADTSTKAL